MQKGNWYKYGIAIVGVAWIAACSKVPDNLLSEKEMQRVLKDMLLAEAMTGRDAKLYPDSASKEALYLAVFRKHGITQALYDSSLVWYGGNLDIYMKVYDRVLKDIEREKTELGDVQAEAAPVYNSDSVDIWPRRPHLTLQPKALFNGVTFDIKPANGYSSGSVFSLGMQVWGLNEHMGRYPEIRLCADQGDTTVVIEEKVKHDGFHRTTLHTIATKRVRRVYGYIRLDGARPTGYYKIFIDRLELMKYNYGSKAIPAAGDSIAAR